ncbi:MAG TPA: cyclopropane-fatty-acyl-phospholipid synthase family protein [Anaerolineales bacterium]|nr:cyclopropane-fatty-acyl-phospholipid synthase family protein [Anaerolineales bacterium]
MAHSVLISKVDPLVEKTADLLERIFPSPRNFVIRLWDGSELPVNGRPSFCLVLKHAGALRRMFKPPVELALGEAYILKDFDIEGDIFSAFSLMDAIASRTFSLGEISRIGLNLMALPTSSAARLHGRGPLQLHGAIHSRERDLLAVQYHYDVGNDFYSLWLDRNLQYSCGYFPTGAEDLDTAQERKMEHICRKLRLKRGERLLDIGCGWGGLARYAALRYGVTVLGVTLSKNQKAYADEQIALKGLQGQVAVELKDYRDLQKQSFEKVVSVGMFEHVGRSHLPEYFAQVNRLLKSGGLFLNHGISRRAASQAGEQSLIAKKVFGRGAFQQKYIFPDGELTPVSEVNAVAEQAGFEVRDVENLREHYALTLRQWVNRLAEHREQAIEVSDEVTYRTWRLYMSASVYGFESGNISVHQTLLAKLRRDGKSNLPLSRADLYD